MRWEIRQIPQESLEHLSCLLGRTIGVLLAEAIRVEYEKWCQSPRFYVPLDDGYLLFECKWERTPQEWFDCYSFGVLRVEEADETEGYLPSLLETPMVGGVRPRCKIFPPMMNKVINRISVWELKEIGVDESIRYDAGLQFTSDDGAEFLLKTTVGMLEAMEYCDDIEAIDRTLRHYHRRLVID